MIDIFNKKTKKENEELKKVLKEKELEISTLQVKIEVSKGVSESLRNELRELKLNTKSYIDNLKEYNELINKMTNDIKEYKTMNKQLKESISRKNELLELANKRVSEYEKLLQEKGVGFYKPYTDEAEILKKYDIDKEVSKLKEKLQDGMDNIKKANEKMKSEIIKSTNIYDTKLVPINDYLKVTTENQSLKKEIELYKETINTKDIEKLPVVRALKETNYQLREEYKKLLYKEQTRKYKYNEQKRFLFGVDKANIEYFRYLRGLMLNKKNKRIRNKYICKMADVMEEIFKEIENM